MSRNPFAIFERKELRILLTLAAIQFCHIVDFMIIMPLGPQLMRTYNILPDQFGFLVSIYNFSAGTAGILSTIFVDRFDRKKVLLFLFFGFIVGTAACGLADRYEHLLLARLFTGAFGGVLTSLSLSIVGDVINYERRATATSIIMTAFSVASIAGVPLSIALAQWQGLSFPYYALAVVSAGIFLLAYFKFPSVGHHITASTEKRSFSPFKAIKGPDQIKALVFMFLLVMGQFLIIPLLSPSLVANAGLTESHLPFIYLVGGVVSIFAGPWVGQIADRKGKKYAFRIGAFSSIIPVLIMTHLQQTHELLILANVALFFLCMSGRVIPATALMTSTVKAESRGAFMSLVSCVQQYASAFASYVATHIVVKSSEGYLQNYQIVGYLAVGATLISIYLVNHINTVEGDGR